MNPLFLLLGFLGPLVGLGALGSGGAKGKPVAPGRPQQDPVQDSVAEPEEPAGTDTPPDTGGKVVDEPVVVQPPATDPTPPPQTPMEPDETPPAISILDSAGAIFSGRVTTLSHDDTDEVTSIRITWRPDHGNVTVNPDNTFALVLTETDHTGSLSFGYEVTYADGSTATFEAPLTVDPGPQLAGWGLGDTHYMLETDANDDIIVEHGEIHREVYVSGSEDALTIADIAALEDLDPSKITGKWLVANSDYGSNPDMALAQDAANALWFELNLSTQGESNWLLLERGYTYDTLDLSERYLQGESELHPVHITSYGEGERPVISDTLKIWHDPSKNIVFSDVAFSGGTHNLAGGNHLYDDVLFTSGGTAHQGILGLTIRNSEFVDQYLDEPGDGRTDWAPHSDRIAGIYAGGGTQGILLEGNLFDHAGWEEGYDPNGSGEFGQPPSMYSHNVYLAASTSDVTFRDNVTMRAASFGAQFRGGAFVEDNVFLDNNIPAGWYGGDYDGAGPVKNYTLFTDNVTTSSGYKFADKIGAWNWGLVDGAVLTTMVDNIVTHLADPNNPEEQAAKPSGRFAVDTDSPYYDDTLVYNWVGSNGSGAADQNIEGLDTAVLDQTTIQLFTAQLLGKETATIADLADYLRAQADGAFDDVVDADLIIRFFQQGFGIAPDLRGEAETLRFVPNDLGDGVRWDNRLNWTTEDLPGTQDGDSVDLAGNWVHYSALTTTIEDLDFGSGGSLTVTSGRLNVEGETELGEWGAKLSIDNAGQYWTNGVADDDLLTVDIDGGRFANTGTFATPTDFSVAENGQAILASDGGAFDLGAGSRLELVGDELRAGFDGDDGGTAVLRLDDESTLGFAADEDGDIGAIEEFRSGAFGDAPNVLSGVNLGSANLEIDASGFDGSSVELISVDELIGIFGGVDVTGLADGKGARIVVDYTNDKVMLEVIDGAGVSLETVGDELSFDVEQAEADALWAALTEGQGTFDDVPVVEMPEEDPLLSDAA